MIDVDSLQLILLNIGYAVHEADWNYKNVKSPFARIFFVIEGTAKIHMPNDRVQELKPEFLYMVPPFTLHSYECNDFFSLYYIHIYENQISGFSVLEDLMYPAEINASLIDSLLVERLYKINPDISLTHYDPLAYDDTQHLFNSINFQSNKPLSTLLETKGILYQLLTRFLIFSKSKYEIVDDRILNVIKHIRKNIDKQITVDELADICFLSKDHFIRIFKKDMHTTPIKYINQKKIERAQLLLLTGNKPIKDIAYDLSFENVYYFNRLFKKIIGMTPSEYRLNW